VAVRHFAGIMSRSSHVHSICHDDPLQKGRRRALPQEQQRRRWQVAS
jgi:hypothetical protein